MYSVKPQDVGLGLRFSHFDFILNHSIPTPWFEVIADDFLTPGPHHEKLLKLRQNKPIVFHSVGLNIGGADDFNQKYLKQFSELYEKFEPEWISDHLCWSAHNGLYHHDLLPIPKTNEAVSHICDRINYLQDYFQRELLIENITSYINYKNEDFGEVEFIKRIVEKTGCKLLLDITNVTINHKNRNLDSDCYFELFPLEHVGQVHLAGGDLDDGVLIDSHSGPVEKSDIDRLIQLYRNGLKAPAMVERDANVPDFNTLEKERSQIAGTLNELL